MYDMVQKDFSVRTRFKRTLQFLVYQAARRSIHRKAVEAIFEPCLGVYLPTLRGTIDRTAEYSIMNLV